MLYFLLFAAMRGDFIFTASALVCALAAAFLASQAHWPSWARWTYGITLALGLALLSHWWIDQLQLWWVTPLGEPMHIITR